PRCRVSRGCAQRPCRCRDRAGRRDRSRAAARGRWPSRRSCMLTGHTRCVLSGPLRTGCFVLQNAGGEGVVHFRPDFDSPVPVPELLSRIVLQCAHRSNRTAPQAKGRRRMSKTTRPSYVIQSVVHASEVLRAFRSRGETLRLRDIVERTGFNKGLCFRLLHTLRYCGLVEKIDETRYRLSAEMHRRKRYRIGYAALGNDSSFQRTVQESLVFAAQNEDVELIVLDNRRSAKTA